MDIMRLSRFWLFFLALILPAQVHANDMALIPGGPFQMGIHGGGTGRTPSA